MSIDRQRIELAAKVSSGARMNVNDMQAIAIRLENPDLTFLHYLNAKIEKEGNDDRRKFYQRLKGNVQKFIDL